MTQNPAVKKTARELLAEELEELKLQTIKPNQLLHDVKGYLPTPVIAAVTSGRGCMALAAKNIVMEQREAEALVDLIAALVDTNQALRQHAERVASLVNLWTTQIRGLESLTDRIVDFAHFRSVVEGDDED